METNFSLLPCPFCGKTESVQVCTASEILGDEFDSSNYESYSGICDSSIGGCGANGGYADTKREAAQNWNMRK